MAVILDMPMQDDAASTAVDDVSASDNNGTLTGGNTDDISVSALAGLKAFSFATTDGSTYVSLGAAIGDGTPVTQYTIEFVVKLNAATGTADIITQSVGPGAVVFINATAMTLTIVDASGLLSLAFDIPVSVDLTEWHKFLLVVDGDDGDLYVDDALEDSQATAGFGDFGVFLDSFGDLLGNGGTSFSIYGLKVTNSTTAPLADPVCLAEPGTQYVALVGTAVTATTGLYAGNPTPTIARQWFRYDDSSGTNPVELTGETSLAYTPVVGDAEKWLRMRETATNSEGSITAYTNYLAAFSPGVLPAPSVTGDLVDTTSFDGQFLYNEAFSDVDLNDIAPDPVSYNTTSPIGDYDWSAVAVAHDGSRHSFGGAIKISNSFVLMSVHGGSSAGDELTWFDKVEEGEVSATIEATWDCGVDGSIRIGRIPFTNTIPNMPLLAKSSIMSGQYMLGRELDRHLNRMQVEAPFSNSTALMTMLTPGVDKIEGGDSGGGGFAIIGTTVVAVMAGFWTGESAEATGPNPSYYLNEIAAILATEGEQLTLAGLEGGSPSGVIGVLVDITLAQQLGLI